MEENFFDGVDWALLGVLQHDASLSNQQLAQRVGVSPATSLRRVKRLQETGVIERQVALLQPERLAEAMGHGLTVLVEVSLDRQSQEHCDAFEARAVADDAVQQCYRVSPGPDFVLVLAVRDMPAFQSVSQRLFTQDANVRNVRSFFSIKRAKFVPAYPLPDVARE